MPLVLWPCGIVSWKTSPLPDWAAIVLPCGLAEDFAAEVEVLRA